MCTTREATTRALEVRRQVYVGRCGYEIPIPDAYDQRSWLLLVEHAQSGAAVGSMRVTPRWGGPLETEEYFVLPRGLRSSRVVEITRFATLHDQPGGPRFLPAVAFGLFILVGRLLERLRVEQAIVCSKPERIWTYEWLKFRRSGIRAPYGKLANSEHELLVCDLRRGSPWRQEGQEASSFRYVDAFEMDHPEIVVPDPLPGFGLVAGVAGESPAVRRSA
ncbi:MAG TPA: hypothetical protein VKW76_15630 [Candidatus Binatia bacterium]|nr:hypothetical protein [Candidatus Binatia bacterium]